MKCDDDTSYATFLNFVQTFQWHKHKQTKNRIQFGCALERIECTDWWRYICIDTRKINFMHEIGFYKF